jgi:hypothetical protein
VHDARLPNLIERQINDIFLSSQKVWASVTIFWAQRRVPYVGHYPALRIVTLLFLGKFFGSLRGRSALSPKN